MPVLKPSPEAIERAAEALRRGELVAFPTETVYGLGADASNGKAVVRIFEAKARPRFNPLIVHVGDLRAAERIAQLSAKARQLAAAFWPGPLTLVARRTPTCEIAELVTAGLETVAVRVPDHPVALALLAASGLAIAAPSANRSGHVSPTRAEHVLDDLGETPAVILDGGACAHGLESTILDTSGDRIVQLRAGAVTVAAIEAVLGEGILRSGESVDPASGERPIAPGQLASHYAPRAPLRLDATRTEPGEALLAFGPIAPSMSASHAGPMHNLSPTADMAEAAANLFAALRRLDAGNPTRIAVMPIPAGGLGEAINDRLRRGAAPR